jgi:hypothetical protein
MGHYIEKTVKNIKKILKITLKHHNFISYFNNFYIDQFRGNILQLIIIFQIISQ